MTDLYMLSGVDDMKIVQLTPGSGDNFYCENCLRDAGLVKAMRGCGADVVMVPMYLPLQTDKDEQVSDGPLFFGGVNVYLQQKLGLFRHTPRWLDWIWDRRGLLEFVGKFAGMTSARDLGETTISMLEGADGRQKKEMDRLLEWLGQEDNRPGVVILSNALLAGLAGAIKDSLGAKVVCLLQDEDGFLDGLGPPYAEKAWGLLRERVKEIDRFVAVSEYFADVMADRLGVGREKIDVVMTGVDVGGYETATHSSDGPVVGYLSRMCRAKGLDTLVDAFIAMKGKAEFANLRLRVAGGRSRSDERFIAEQVRKLDKCGLMGDVEFLATFGQAEKVEFLRSLSVMCVPERESVSCGLYVLEAMAAGVPVVQPRSGVFVEVIEASGGGVLVDEYDAVAFAKAIEGVLGDVEMLKRMGQKGIEAVREKFDIMKSAKKMIGVCENVTQK